jgi:hypothetical protein
MLCRPAKLELLMLQLVPLLLYTYTAALLLLLFAASNKQRLRWAVGAIQIVLAGCPLFIKGLPYRARWLYFFSTVGIVYIIPVVLMGIIMYSTILAGAPISFGPTSFEQYLVIGGSSVVLMMLMQYLAGWRLSRRDYMRALQDNFTVFMTLIRAILIGFLGFEMGFAVTNKVCTVAAAAVIGVLLL